MISFYILAQNPKMANFAVFCVFESICGKVGDIFLFSCFLLVNIFFLPDTNPVGTDFFKTRRVRQHEKDAQGVNLSGSF